MYIFEVLYKIFRKKKNISNSEESSENNEECNHVFLPIDSTADYLACNKCGFVVKNDKINTAYEENFFKF